MTKKTKAPGDKPKSRSKTGKRKSSTGIKKPSAKIEVEVDAGVDDIHTEKLTLKAELFCQAYIENGGNASAAYRTAYGAEGYSSKSVNERASQFMKVPKILSRINKLRSDMLARHQVTADRIISEYAKLAFSNMNDYIRNVEGGLASVDLSNVTEDQTAAIQEIKVDRLRGIKSDNDDGEDGYVERVTLKLSDKRAALADLSKIMRLYRDNTEINITNDLGDLLDLIDGKTQKSVE